MDELDELESFLSNEEKTCIPRARGDQGCDPTYYAGICTEIAYVRGKIAEMRARRKEQLVPAYLERADAAHEKILSIIRALPKEERDKLGEMLSGCQSCDNTCRRKHCDRTDYCCDPEEHE